MMEGLMTMRFALKNDLMTTVRLATGGVCSLAGLDLDASEDCKVCVTESLLLLLRGGFRSATLSFSCEETLRVRIAGEGERERETSGVEDGLSVALLRALVETLTLEGGESSPSAVVFEFGI